jgi:hypothetical protein
MAPVTCVGALCFAIVMGHIQDDEEYGRAPHLTECVKLGTRSVSAAPSLSLDLAAFKKGPLDKKPPPKSL